jgi:hypothetical protein
LLSLAVWLLRHDLARRTVRQRGLTRFIACSLLAGYAWLAIAGALIMAEGLQPGTRVWDAALHAVLLGFVFSMVFGHAPIVLPAVLRVSLPYRPQVYLPLILLHLSVAGRVSGSLAGAAGLRQAAAWLSAAALAAFIVTTVAAVRGRGRRDARTGPQGAAAVPGSARPAAAAASAGAAARWPTHGRAH